MHYGSAGGRATTSKIMFCLRSTLEIERARAHMNAQSLAKALSDLSKATANAASLDREIEMLHGRVYDLEIERKKLTDKLLTVAGWGPLFEQPPAPPPIEQVEPARNSVNNVRDFVSMAEYEVAQENKKIQTQRMREALADIAAEGS